ncbi:MAG: hypothetical protein L0I09_05235, partial [Lactobacillus sp.]|nr:hypothetical protein [Lactobacillus sp.]
MIEASVKCSLRSKAAHHFNEIVKMVGCFEAMNNSGKLIQVNDNIQTKITTLTGISSDLLRSCPRSMIFDILLCKKR